MAFKDLSHNKSSSLYITSVIASICLPMIVLFSLRDGYVELFKEWLEKTTPAKQLGVQVKSGDSSKITKETIKQWNDSLKLNLVVPHIERTGFIPTKKGSNLRMDFISTVEGNPELERLGLRKTSEEKFGIYLPENKKSEYIIDSLENTIKVILERGDFRQSLRLPILGYTQDKKKDAYLSLLLMQYYEKWTFGHSINDNEIGISLPADKSTEADLPGLLYDSLTLFKVTNFDKSKVRQLREQEGFIARNGTSKNLFYIGCSKPSKFSDFDLRALEGRFSSTYNAVAIPEVTSLEGKGLILTPSSKYDPRSNYILSKGSWMSGSKSRLEIVIPEKMLDRHQLNSTHTIELGGQNVKLLIVGSHKNESEEAFIDFEVLARLNQVKQGIAKFDVTGEKFEPNVTIDYDNYPVDIAMVHVENLEDVIPSYQFFERNNYDIPQSSISQISHYLDIKNILTKIVLGLTFLCAIACILSLLVLMLEIIRRKSSEIGINKVIGIDEKFINNVFISQACFYGIAGLLLSLFVFFVLRILGESKKVNEFFGLNVDDNILQLSTSSFLLILTLILIVSWFAGWRATSATKNIDPADIIIKN